MSDDSALVPAKEWYGKGLHFSCSMCGNCCSGPSGTVRFTDAEIDGMAEAVGLLRVQFLQQYVDRRYGMLSLKEIKKADGSYDCIFLRDMEGGKRGCALYKARPLQCQTWPFWPSNLVSEAAWKDAARTCSGMKQGGLEGKGKRHDLQTIELTVKQNTFRL